MTKIRNIAVVLALMSVSVLAGYHYGKIASMGGYVNENAPFSLTLMNEVKAKLQGTYLDKNQINDQKMMYGAIAGMVSSLDDPYTMFLSPDQNKSANDDLSGTFGGVGIELGYKDKNMAVMAPLANTPAAKAGIQAGDLILKITDKANKIDQDTSGLSLNEAVALIRGKIGTEVTLKLYREGKADSFDVTLKRDNIVVPSAELVWKEQNGKQVAWVKLYKFSEQLYTEWPKIVSQIVEKHNEANYGGIVLDLRNNPGGYLEASVMVASDLLDSGVVVQQQTSDGKVTTYDVDKSKRQLVNDKLVVLVNGGSASASEILAGALRDHQRAKLVGENTFGKGTVQQPENFPDGSGIHITVAKWLLPSGVNIHKVGVAPDVEVKFQSTPEATQSSTFISNQVNTPDNQLDKAIEILLGK